jgi:hypothetical protein
LIAIQAHDSRIWSVVSSVQPVVYAGPLRPHVCAGALEQGVGTEVLLVQSVTNARAFHLVPHVSAREDHAASVCPAKAEELLVSPLPYGHSTFTVRYGCFRTALLVIYRYIL